MRPGRLEAFSDGVLAIVITIMVLELKVPQGDTWSALRHATGVGLLSYLLSFTYVGIYWANHHHMFQLVERVTGGVLWANLGLLFCLSLFPFTTAWADQTRYARFPVIAYGVNLIAAGAAYWVLQSVILRSQGAGSPMARAVGRDFKGKASVVVYAAGIAFAAALGEQTRAGVWLAVASYVAVAVWWMIPDRRIERVVAERAAMQAVGDRGPATEERDG